jgi:hypothetical protein
MKVDGRCLCGFIRYVAEADPEQALACHCTDCQVLSSSAFRQTVPAKHGTFKLLTGELKIYVKIAESGNRRALAFCPNCGTSIYSAPVEGSVGDTYFGLRVGPLAQRDQLPPKSHCWTRSRQPWVKEMASLPEVEKE